VAPVTLNTVADSTLPIPGGTGTFTSFNPDLAGFPPNPCISDGNVAFWGAGSGGQQGVYIIRQSQPLSIATVAASDFGSPPTTTNYLLCLYDNSGEKLSAQAPADRMCGTTPCWKALGTVGFKYGDTAGMPDGLTKALLKAGGASKGKISVTGGGANLHLPTLPLTTPVRVQLRQSSSSVCWEATYSTATTNSAGEFKAKSD